MEQEYKPANPEKDPLYNQEPGVFENPNHPYSKEMIKFEQFPNNRYGSVPGNPYVKREYPKMLYRAQHWNGKVCCMAAPPDPIEFADPREWERNDERARKFSESCQRTVQNEHEKQRAMEDGWREHPDEAVAYLRGRDKDESTATAHRNYEDRNMSDKAKLEAKKLSEEAGLHLPEIPEQPRQKRKYTRRIKPNITEG